MLWIIISLFVLAAITPWIEKWAGDKTGWILGAVPLGWTFYLLGHSPAISRGETFLESSAWLADFNVYLSFNLDGLSLIFALLILGIGALVVFYTAGYMHGHPQINRFYSFTLIFMSSMVGVVLADNIIAMFVFWELTSVSSYLLIGFDHKRAEARYAALQALVVTGLGGLAMLAGLLILGNIAGTYEITAILTQGDLVREHALYTPMLILILLGAFTKSAQFPFHFWLPNAMQAPTPASAYLHSSTMVKAGIYLIARLSPALAGTEFWQITVTTVGAITMLVAAYLALYQTYLKPLLAYTTLAVLGTLTMLLGEGSNYAVKAAMVYLIAHAFYKGGLFMVAGIIDHETGEKNVTKLGGLRGAMPITFAAALLLAISMMGTPPMFGFLGKETLYDATVGAHFFPLLLTLAAFLSSAAMVAVAGFVAIKPFIGEQRHTPKHPHEAPLTMWIGPAVLAACGVFCGLAPGWTGAMLISPSASAVLGETMQFKLSLWHGFNLVLLLSVLTLLVGAAVYFAWGVIRSAQSLLAPLHRVGPAAWYDGGMKGLVWTADNQTRFLQSGYLRYYLMAIMVATIGLTAYITYAKYTLPFAMDFSDIRFYEFFLTVLMLSAAVAAIHSKTRLGSIAALGVVGYSVALIYVLYGAPDLAMTQFVVETLTVIIFVLVFYHLPSYKTLTSTVGRTRDVIIALAFGGMITTMILIANQIQLHPTISHYFGEYSYTKAYGHNVVNVILVDFRAIDTMGEITVLAVAALGAFALLKYHAREESED